jgi:choloylglycine hydrolase
MKKIMLGILFYVLFICLVPVQSLPCTTFVLNSGTSVIVGKNFDWPLGLGFLTVNKRGVSKVAARSPYEPDAKPAAWTSRFGSITFNYLERVPIEGINEAGLVIQNLIMRGEGVQYPEPDSRAAIDYVLWTEYLLDNFKSVEEVIASDKDVRICHIQPPPLERMHRHALIADSTGNCAIIEFIGGKMVCHTGENLPVKVLTNNTYDTSMEYVRTYTGFGGTEPITVTRNLIAYADAATNSLPRFALAADMVRKFDSWSFVDHELSFVNRSSRCISDANMAQIYGLQTSGPAVDYAFDILSSVSQPTDSFSPTMWSTVYDITNRTVYFQTTETGQVRYVQLSTFDFSCSPVKALDINADLANDGYANLSSDVSRSFIDLTGNINRQLMRSFAPGVTDELLDNFEDYIQGQFCVEN